MKNLICLLLIVLFVAGCSSSKDEKEIELSVSPESLLFTAEGVEELTFEINSNDQWTITEVEDWFTLDQSKGDGNETIVVKVKPNNIEESRSTELKVRAGNLLRTITIRQAGKNIALEVSVLKIEAEAIETSASFDILSNDSWEIEGITEWLKFEVTKGKGNQTVNVLISENISSDDREAIVQVKSGSKTQKITFTQKKGATILNIKELVLDFYSNAEQSEFEIESDGVWELSCDADWCQLDKTTGANNEKVKFQVTENRNIEERRAIITARSGTLESSLLVKQAGFIVVSDNPYQINRRDHAPRIGDNIVKKQIEYVDPGSSGENVTWTYNNLKVINQDYDVKYENAPLIRETKKFIMGYDVFSYDEPKAKSLIVATEHYTMYYFNVGYNGLLAFGHENVSIKFQYNPRMILEKYPMYYNDSYKNDYKANGLYSGVTWVKSEGYMEVKADAYGTLVINGKTINNVIRLKYRQLIKDTTEDVVTIDDEDRIMETYKWFAKGYRYPVLEEQRLLRAEKGTVLFSTGFYCVEGNVKLF